MYEISIFNTIAESGLSLLDPQKYHLKKEALDSADGIVLRSYDLKKVEFPQNLKAIARAGAGVNNIPVEACCHKGIVVFNAPGANANGVKELTLLGMLISSRKICEGVAWSRSLTGDVESQVEKGKKNYAGPELKGKTLGVVGLGAVGVEVANMGIKLGMKVVGYDPFLSLERALGLSWDVQYHPSLDSVLRESDYISLHVPLMDETSFYYANIVLPYSPQVRKVFESLGTSGWEIDMIAPDHGVVWRSHVDKILEAYDRYSRQVTKAKAVIVYDTMWHSTEKMAKAIGEGLSDEGVSYTLMHLKAYHTGSR